MNEELRACPFCGSKNGYYVVEKLHRFLMFKFDGTPDWGTEDVSDYVGARKHCRNCEKIIPKKYFDE